MDVNVRPITHAPVLREQVFAALEELIIEGALPPGKPLSESELADQLGVSRNPVREALTLLAHAGFVDLRPRQVAMVHQPTEKEIEDFFQIRGVLEEESARLAARNATPDDVAELEELLEDGRATLSEGDDARTAQANSAFHARVGEIADNSVLDQMLDLMEKRLRWYFARVAQLRGPDSWDEHAQLVEALAGNDIDEAGAVMRAHNERTANLYRQSHGLSEGSGEPGDEAQ